MPSPVGLSSNNTSPAAASGGLAPLPLPSRRVPLQAPLPSAAPPAPQATLGPGPASTSAPVTPAAAAAPPAEKDDDEYSYEDDIESDDGLAGADIEDDEEEFSLGRSPRTPLLTHGTSKGCLLLSLFSLCSSPFSWGLPPPPPRLVLLLGVRSRSSLSLLQLPLGPSPPPPSDPSLFPGSSTSFAATLVPIPQECFPASRRMPCPWHLSGLA
eukprot:gene14914-20967_t